MRATIAVTIVLTLAGCLGFVPWPAVCLPLLARQLRRDFRAMFFEREQPDLATALLAQTIERR